MKSLISVQVDITSADRMSTHDEAALPLSVNDRDYDLVLSALYQAMGSRDARMQPSNEGNYYNTSFSNTDYSLLRLINELRCTKSAQVALLGPSGTGKTRFVHHLADMLDTPLIVVSVSELMDMTSKESCSTLNHMLTEANKIGAIVNLDEPDHILDIRKGVNEGWLAQRISVLMRLINQFQGITVLTSRTGEYFIGTDGRAFDIKVHFDYLTRDQIWMQFNMVLGRSQPVTFDAASVDYYQTKLALLPPLTAAGFARVYRNCHEKGELLTPSRLLTGLDDAQRSMGEDINCRDDFV